MPQYKYTARNTTGKVIEGVIEAQVQKVAMDKLRGQRYTVMNLVELKSESGSFLDKINPFKPGVKAKDLSIFSRQLATLVSAGVPIVQGLNILEEQIESPAFKKVISGVRSDIESGIAIADALKKHPKAFSELYVSMIRAGETGGVLDTILERLSNYLEAAEELKSKVKGAMVYPSVVIGVSATVTLFLMVGVIPTFKKVFSSFGQELPFPTRVLMAISDGLTDNLLLIVAFPVGIFFLLRWWYGTEKGTHGDGPIRH